ncbi:MAG: hypothetical protein RLZZ565_1645, partial [Planctomycetota bacterium]
TRDGARRQGDAHRARCGGVAVWIGSPPVDAHRVGCGAWATSRGDCGIAGVADFTSRRSPRQDPALRDDRARGRATPRLRTQRDSDGASRVGLDERSALECRGWRMVAGRETDDARGDSWRSPLDRRGRCHRDHRGGDRSRDRGARARAGASVNHAGGSAVGAPNSDPTRRQCESCALPSLRARGSPPHASPDSPVSPSGSRLKKGSADAVPMRLPKKTPAALIQSGMRRLRSGTTNWLW